MSNSKKSGTVLVLGAGASKDYGFPLGKGLRDIVCDLCINQPNKFAEHGIDLPPIKRTLFPNQKEVSYAPIQQTQEDLAVHK